MAGSTKIPAAVVLRLSRYHCFLGELEGSLHPGRIRSREIAEELGLSEETVRHDLSYIDNEGRPGAGYDSQTLLAALQDFLDLSTEHPFIAIGNRDILAGLSMTFPAEAFGLRAVGYFSDRSEDVGQTVTGLEIHPASEIPVLARSLGVTIALVACEPGSVDETLEILSGSGVNGVLLLTPVLRPKHPEGMTVTYFRIPCALKSLVSAEGATRTCCHAVGCA